MSKPLQYPMTKEQYRAALEEFELSQAHAAWLFNGKSKASGRRWATEGAPFSTALIITMMRVFELTPGDIEHFGRQWRKRKERADL